MDNNLEQARIDTQEAKGFLSSDYDNFDKLTTIDDGNGNFANVVKYKSIAIRRETIYPFNYKKSFKGTYVDSFENKMKKSEIAIANDVSFAPTLDYDIRTENGILYSHHEFMPMIEGITLDKDIDMEHVSKLNQDEMEKYFRDWDELMRIGLKIDSLKLSNFIVTDKSINFIDLDNRAKAKPPFQQINSTSLGQNLVSAVYLLLYEPFRRHKLYSKKNQNCEIVTKYKELNSVIQKALNSKQFKQHNGSALSYAKEMVGLV